MSGGPRTFDLLQDVRSLGGPDEGLRVGVVLRVISFNGFDQCRDIGKAAAADLFLGQVSKKALDHVEPGGTGGSEMNVEAFMFLQPGLHVRMFVR